MSTKDYPRAEPQPTVVTSLPGTNSGRVDRTASSGFTWTPRVMRCDVVPATTSEPLSEATPANTELRRWAARPKNQPPQSWWDDTTDPFEPVSD